MMGRRERLLLMGGVTVAAVVAVALLPPIRQSPAYFGSADQRTLLGIPSFADVVSNLPFLVVGAWGVLFALKERHAPGNRFLARQEAWPYVVFFAGVGLTCIGSAYYHWAPSNATLVWDRLPMTLAFMGIFSASIAEQINPKLGVRLLPVLAALGIASVVYWRLGELRGAGDLRPYGLVQFFPLLAIPLLVLLFPRRYTRSADLLVALGIYAVAKAFEVLDVAIFRLGHVVSGHTLKHLAAALAVYWILRMLQKREARSLNH